jgi:type VI secretion system protein ImpA
MNGVHNGTAGGRGLAGEISSRDDVIRALDKICAYYARYEPSSPLPMFMERCKKLVSKSFIDIVRDLVPDALSQVEVFKGRDE